MSKNKLKKEAGRARKAAREEEQGKKVMRYIIGCMAILFVILFLYATIMMG